MKRLFISGKEIIALFAVIVLFFWPIALGKIPVPADSLIGLYHPWRDSAFLGFSAEKFPVKNPIATDPILQSYPWRYIAMDLLKKGEMPLWNPYNFAGQPLMANMQSSPLQAQNLIFLLLPFKFGWSFQIVLTTFLSGVFLYIFLRSIKLPRTAALYSGTVLPFTGYFVAWQAWQNVVATAMWLPLILFCFVKIKEKPTVILISLLSFSIFQLLVSGHVQTASYVLLASIIFLTVNNFRNVKLKKSILLVCAIIIGFMLSAPQLLPTIEFASFSNRSSDQFFFEGRQDWFLPLKHLVQAVAPDFFGNPTTNNYWGVWNWGEFVTYIGVTPLFLAILAVLTKFKGIKFPLALLIIALLLGTENPLSEFLLTNLPLISTFQPSRIVFLIVFALVMLSAYGIQSLIEEKFTKKVLTAASATVLLATVLILLPLLFKNLFPSNLGFDAANVSFRNSLLPLLISIILTGAILLRRFFSLKVFITLLFVLTLIDLYRFAGKYVTFTNSSVIFPATPSIDFLASQKQPFRVMSTDRRITSPNSLSAYNIESIGGYDPLYLEDYANFISASESGTVSEARSFGRIITPQNYQSPLLSLLNVKYVLTFDELKGDDFVKVFQEGKTQVWENKRVLPRAFLVKELEQMSHTTTLEALLTIADPTETSLSDYVVKNGDKFGKLEIVYYKEQSIKLYAEVSRSTPLIITNVNYPGWKAYLDNVKTDMFTVNYLFQGIIIPQGEHTVEIKYQPQAFIAGLYIASIGLASLILLNLLIWKRKLQ